MTFLVFHYYTHEPIVYQKAPDPEGFPIGTFVYHKGQWAYVAIVPPKNPRNRFDVGHKTWLLMPEYQVPKTIRLSALLLR